MAYTPVPTYATNDLFTAANANTYWRDNFAAGIPDIYTDVGQMAYATAADVAGVLNIGTTLQQMRTNAGATAPEWFTPIVKKNVCLVLVDPDTTPSATGDGIVQFLVPVELNGYVLTDADAVVTTVSSSGTPTFALRRERSGAAVDMLSTNITIDENEKTSYTAATPPVINSSNDDVATGDIIYVDLDVVGTGAKGHAVVLTFTS